MRFAPFAIGITIGDAFAAVVLHARVLADCGKVFGSMVRIIR